MPFVDESKVTEWTNRLKSYFALLTHKHDASDITSGALGVARGGTGGSTALDARKNLSVPVDSSIAYVESTTATTNHASGDYFILGGVLMRATAAIATGEQITTSNATPATVQSQIDTLRDSVGHLHVQSAIKRVSFQSTGSTDVMLIAFELTNGNWVSIEFNSENGIRFGYRIGSSTGPWTYHWTGH